MKLYHTENSKIIGQTVDLDEVTFRCLQIQLFSSLIIKELRVTLQLRNNQSAVALEWKSGKAGFLCVFFYYAPVTIVGGIKICPCLSVCLSVRPFVTLYGIEFV